MPLGGSEIQSLAGESLLLTSNISQQQFPFNTRVGKYLCEIAGLMELAWGVEFSCLSYGRLIFIPCDSTQVANSNPTKFPSEASYALLPTNESRLHLDLNEKSSFTQLLIAIRNFLLSQFVNQTEIGGGMPLFSFIPWN